MGGLVSYTLLAGFGFAWYPYTAFVFFAWIMGRGPPLHHSRRSDNGYRSFVVRRLSHQRRCFCIIVGKKTVSKEKCIKMGRPVVVP
jgi:hypothetical protein